MREWRFNMILYEEKQEPKITDNEGYIYMAYWGKRPDMINIFGIFDSIGRAYEEINKNCQQVLFREKLLLEKIMCISKENQSSALDDYAQHYCTKFHIRRFKINEVSETFEIKK